MERSGWGSNGPEWTVKAKEKEEEEEDGMFGSLTPREISGSKLNVDGIFGMSNPKFFLIKRLEEKNRRKMRKLVE